MPASGYRKGAGLDRREENQEAGLDGTAWGTGLTARRETGSSGYFETLRHFLNEEDGSLVSPTLEVRGGNSLHQLDA